MKKSGTEMYAGLALFFSMYYVLEANPEILREIGVPVSAALFGTFLAIIFGNLAGAFVTNTGLMIAPAIGISVFVKNFVLHSDSKLDWRHAMMACALAGVAVFLTSVLTNWREQIVDDLPESVSKGAKAGIGALLIKEAFDIFEHAQKHNGLEPRGGQIAVTFGVVFLVLFFLIRSRIEDAAPNERPLTRLFMRLEFLLVVALMFAYLSLFQPDYIASLPHNELSFLWQNPFTVFSGAKFGSVELLLMCLLAATVWFIIMSDIPGTPNEILPDEIKASGPRAVRGGYINDGIFAILSPLFGTTPTIYYAENHILKSFDVYSRRVSFWATGLFTLVLFIELAGQYSPALRVPIQKFLSPIAILPILIFIGLYIISVSFLQAPDRKSADSTVPARSPQYYFPSAISVILTSRIGLEYALPLSVLSFWLVRSETDTYGPSFKFISIGSAVSLIVFGCLFAGS